MLCRGSGEQSIVCHWFWICPTTETSTKERKKGKQGRRNKTTTYGEIEGTVADQPVATAVARGSVVVVVLTPGGGSSDEKRKSKEGEGGGAHVGRGVWCGGSERGSSDGEGRKKQRPAFRRSRREGKKRQWRRRSQAHLTPSLPAALSVEAVLYEADRTTIRCASPRRVS